MTITLIISGTSYDITNYVSKSSLSFSDSIDETLGSGGFTIPYIESTTLGYDMSNPIPRFSKITIEDGNTYYYYVTEDVVTLIRKSDKMYSHKVTLIEPTKILQKRVIPNQTIRQPQGNLTDYDYIINTDDDDYFDTYSPGYVGTIFANTNFTLSTDNGISTDTSVIDGMTLKLTQQYQIYVTYDLYNRYGFDSELNPQLWDLSLDSVDYMTITADILINSVVVDTQTIIINNTVSGIPNQVHKTISINYTPSSANEVVELRFKNSNYSDSLGLFSAESMVNNVSIKIQSKIGTDVEKYMLDQVVDKLLASVKVFELGNEDYEFTLADETRARLSQVLSPEFTWQGYTLYEALQEIASYVAAQVYLGENDFTTIYFYYYDDNYDEKLLTYNEEEYHLQSNDYVTGLEINAQNVIKEDSLRFVKYEPYYDGYMTIRLNQDGFGQITDTLASILLKNGIYRPQNVYVRGLAFTMYDGATPVNFANSEIWNIKNFVVEQTKYSALQNTSSANSRSASLDKGNTVYYVQGQNRILNLGYNDVLQPPGWLSPNPLNYAVVEAILCQAQVENPSYTFTADYTPTVSIFDLEFSIEYVAYAETRVTVYKDDFQNEQTEVQAYFNEQAQLNDMVSLGQVAQKHVNRRGNQLSYYKAYLDTLGYFIRLGQKNALNEKLTRYTVNYTPTYKVLSLEYTKNYANISSYRGIPSQYRQWEIPNTNIVTRFDKFTDVLYLSKTDVTPTNSVIQDYESIWDNYKLIQLGRPSSYAKISLDYDGLGYTDYVEGSVDTQAYGNTLVITVKMYDNYSAGAYLDEQSSIKYQRDARYTDNIGRVKNVKYQIYNKLQSLTLGNTFADLYPSNNMTPTGVTLKYEIEYNINKDAGEIMAFAAETVFKPKTSDIVVFDGFAKYCGLNIGSFKSTARPFLLKSGYFPQKDEVINENKLVSLSLLKWSTSISGRSHQTRITSPIGTYEGYIWIETKTGEPIFAVRSDNFDSTTGTVQYNETVYIGG